MTTNIGWNIAEFGYTDFGYNEHLALSSKKRGGFNDYSIIKIHYNIFDYYNKNSDKTCRNVANFIKNFKTPFKFYKHDVT